MATRWDAKRLFLALGTAALVAGCNNSKSVLMGGAQAAAWVSVASPNGLCAVSDAVRYVPDAENLTAALRCDSGKDCSVGVPVVADGDEGTDVACTFAPSGDAFALNASFSYRGTGFTVEGTVPNPENYVTMSHHFAEAGETLSGECFLAIDGSEPDEGALKGEFWCGDYPVWSYGVSCEVWGRFLFTGCERRQSVEL